MKIACAHIDTSISDCEHNESEIINTIINAAKCNTDIIVFPELSITGYSCGNIFLNRTLLHYALSSLKHIKDATKEWNIIIAVGLPFVKDNLLYDCAALIYRGKILGIVPKTRLRNTDGYSEQRWFCPWTFGKQEEIDLFDEKIPFGQPLIFNPLSSVNISIEIGSDTYEKSEVDLKDSSLVTNVIINLAAVHETVNSPEKHLQIGTNHDLQNTVYIYCSGGTESTTDFAFESYKSIHSFGIVIAETEEKYLEAEVDSCILANNQNNHASTANSDLFSKKDFILEPQYQTKDNKIIFQEPFMNGMPEDTVSSRILRMQSKALTKKMKYMNRDKLILGISGGLDSTVALLSCYQCFVENNWNLKNIIGISMPGPGTTERTYNNSLRLMNALGITSIIVDIRKSTVTHLKNIGQPDELYDITYEQTQSRERTKILMDFANKENGIVIGTGDMSEFALGWMSYSGDQISMYAINAGIPKTVMRHFANWYLQTSDGELHDTIKDILCTPVSPELLPLNELGEQKQSTEMLVGPYIVHDFFLYHFISDYQSIEEIFHLACTAFHGQYSSDLLLNWLKIFVTRFFTRQYKRSCFSDGLQVFDIGLSPRDSWKMPSDVSPDMWLKEIERLRSK